MKPLSLAKYVSLAHRLSLAARSCCLLIALPLLVLRAQDSSAVSRAISSATSGDSAKARAILDSVLTPRTALAIRAEASYWRSEFSESPAEREKALSAFVIDYPFSPHYGTALYTLGMLELGHSDRDRAANHLTQFLANAPADSNRSTASLTLARILFDRGEPARGCAVVLNGRAELPPTAVELRNQFDFMANPCAGVDTSSTPKARPDSAMIVPTVAVDTVPKSSLGEYTIQVAAYDTKAQADRLATRLRGAGYEARVVGTKKPFRVRVGHYPTHPAADAVSKKIEALVKLKPFVLLLGPEDM